MSIAIIGGRSDGQAGVVIDIINNIFNQKVEYIFDTTPELKGKIIKGAKVVGSFRNCAKRYLKDISGIHIAIGDNQSRLDYYKLSNFLCSF